MYKSKARKHEGTGRILQTNKWTKFHLNIMRCFFTVWVTALAQLSQIGCAVSSLMVFNSHQDMGLGTLLWMALLVHGPEHMACRGPFQSKPSWESEANFSTSVFPSPLSEFIRTSAKASSCHSELSQHPDTNDQIKVPHKKTVVSIITQLSLTAC